MRQREGVMLPSPTTVVREAREEVASWRELQGVEEVTAQRCGWDLDWKQAGPASLHPAADSSTQ